MHIICQSVLKRVKNVRARSAVIFDRRMTTADLVRPFSYVATVIQAVLFIMMEVLNSRSPFVIKLLSISLSNAMVGSNL